MNKLVLLSCLVLLAFQVQADHIQETDEETKTEEQPGEEDKAVSVSFGGPGGSAPHGELLRDLVCYCRKAGCTRKERMNGTCRKGNLMYTLCCH